MVKTTYEINVHDDDGNNIFRAYRFSLSAARNVVSRICRHFEEQGYEIGNRSIHVYCDSYSESRLLSKPFDYIDVTILNNDCALQDIDDGYVFFASDGNSHTFRTIDEVKDWFNDIEMKSELKINIH